MRALEDPNLVRTARFMGYAATLGIDQLLINGRVKLRNKQWELANLKDSIQGQITVNSAIKEHILQTIHSAFDELGIPKELRPEVKLFNSKKIGFGGMYVPSQHLIIVNAGGRKTPDWSLTFTCRHEAKHAQQYLELARAGKNDQLKDPLPKSIANLAVTMFPQQNIAEERLEAANNYKYVTQTRSTHNGRTYLLELNAKRLGFKSLKDFYSRANAKDRVNFWDAVCQDLKPGKTLFRDLGDIAKIAVDSDIKTYVTHPFEMEANLFAIDKQMHENLPKQQPATVEPFITHSPPLEEFLKDYHTIGEGKTIRELIDEALKNPDALAEIKMNFGQD